MPPPGNTSTSPQGGAAPTVESTSTAAAQISTSPQIGTATSATSAGAHGSVPTGKQLAALLAAATPPTGFTSEPSGAMDSGANLVQDPGSYIGLKDCTGLTHAGADNLVTDYKSSDAQTTIRSQKGDEVDILVAAFAPGDADKQWQEVAGMYTKCATYQSGVLGGGTASLKATSTPVSGLGDQAVDLKIQATTPGYVSEHTLLARVGDRIIAVGTDSQEAASVDLKPYAKAYLPALSK